MNGGVEFNGLVGANIFLATVILLAVIALINLTAYILDRNSRKSESKWSKYFLKSAIILLLFDGIFFVLVFLQGNRTWSRAEAIAFDDRMLTIWIPFHIIGYFLLAVMFRFIRLRKEKINKFIDKFR